MTPDKPRAQREHVFLVQVLASVEVRAPDRQTAGVQALTEIAQRCANGRDLFVRVEELKG